MLRKTFKLLRLGVVLLVAYLIFWPVQIAPVAWEAPPSKGYTGDYFPNTALKSIERIDLNGETGPEDAAEGPDGRIFMASHGGKILAYDPVKGTTSEFADTGGLPLGISALTDGTIVVADAAKGLLSITPSGVVSVLTDTAPDGTAINYADDLDIAPDGSIYFTDASTKFGAVAFGGTFPASFLDLMEHGGHGRVLKFDPATGQTSLVMDGLNFANGLAINAAGTHFLLVETGEYSITRVALDGSDPTTIVENTPCFPDNIARAQDGTFWFGCVSPRSEDADNMSTKPFLRKLVMRLPASMRPEATRYGLVVHIDEIGKVLETLQDPTGGFAYTTGLIEARDGTRYITSLREPNLGKLAP
ncbi:SMP-30/gluconolactonase/LRE family protein [Pseudosulfitobacter sp. SM2401]|uniref:SMP-30/gluconolactonase/LRE family protein n=1 Tax=Pseudosulfitobacter sp. SM2401 TaxID=3350098 RepID=UPI0036F1B54E